MKRLILLMITCYCLLPGHANTDIASDSLLQVLQTLPHDTTRLSTLNDIIKIEQNNYKCIQYSDTLMQEALKLKNDKYASLAAYYHLLYYYNRSEQDSVAKWIVRMEPYVQRSGLWDYFFDAQRFQIDLYTFTEQYELAISEANKMKQKALNTNSNRGTVAAYQCLSNAYIGSQRWDEGLKALEEAYRLLPKKGNAVVHISVLSQLISVTKEMKDNNRQLKYLQELESVLRKFIIDNPSLKDGFADVFIFNEIFYAHYYLNTNQPLLAYSHIEKSKKYLTENTYFMYKVLYYDIYAEYYQSIKQYQQASAYIDTTLTMLKKDFTSDYAEQLLKQAKIWVEAEDYNKATTLYQQALAIKDSAAMALSNTQMEQIKKSYNLDKRELKQQKQTNQIRLTSLVAITAILIVLFISLFRLFKIRKALKYSESEIRKAAETVRVTNEIKNRFLSNMSYNIRTPLNNVVGFSQLIASEPNIDENTREEYSAIIHQSSEKLMRLVNDVLDLSRLEAKMMKFQIQDYDAVALCNEVCYMARMNNEKTGIQIRFTSEVDSLSLHTDTTRLGHALLSTLTYPQEYEPEEQPEERIIYFTVSRNGGMLQFRILNSPLADENFTSQESIIRHEINQLLLAYFGGIYQVNAQGTEGSEIVFAYPIASESE